ncbi:hypothetical protein [Methylomonas sp. 11b]|uniref:hypothetical protein n=1 Tax=Methylomonas sp. 11b TaxID=1168169 RepID=UPI00047C3522|nr:hypothetical protein [Methylomonas sp. 11b]
MIYTADKKCRCVLCDKDIPAGHKYWKKSDTSGRQHLNCCDYETPIADAAAEKDLQSQLARLRAEMF